MHLVLTAFAAAAEASSATDVISLVITSVVSATVFSALITGLVQFIINRRNSRITERKNTVDAESDIVTRYKDQASEERTAKESAVKMIRELMEDSKEQVRILKSTVDTLTNTITLLETLTTSQKDMIEQLTQDRDRTQAALERAEERIKTQRQQLQDKTDEIQSLLQQSRERLDRLNSGGESFDLS